jgi:hypothetical protein
MRIYIPKQKHQMLQQWKPLCNACNFESETIPKEATGTSTANYQVWPPFSIEINHHYTQLHFGDGETYTWPIKHNRDTTDRYAFSATTSEQGANPLVLFHSKLA